jgi:hypothetical protein
MTRPRNAVCPSCGASVTLTYWPFNVPLYTVHVRSGSNRDCRASLRPLEGEEGDERPSATAPPRR